MSEKIFDARLQLKYDTYDRWNAADLILKEGEMAVATIPIDSSASEDEYAVIIKVGNGAKPFKDLPTTMACAADVFSWAKAENKPSYDATEITGLGSYIADYISDQIGVSVDTDTQYQLVLAENDEPKYKLQCKDKSDSTWADVEGSVIDLSGLNEALELVGGMVLTLMGEDFGKSAREIAAEVAAEELAKQLIAENAAESLDTLEEIASWIQSHPNDAAAMNSAISALQTKIDTGDKKISVYVSDAIAALKASLKIEDYALAADLTALAGRVLTIENKTTSWDKAEQNAKDYARGLVEGLDVIDSEVTSNVVTAVNQTDGKISVSRRQLTVDDIAPGTKTLIIDCGNSDP